MIYCAAANKHNILFFFIGIFLLCIFGCYNSSKDVSKNLDLWGGFKYQKEYEVIADIFLIKVTSGLETERLALSPEEELFQEAKLYMTPRTIKEYTKDANGMVNNVVGIVNAGTRIVCTLLHQNKGFSLWFGFHNGLTKYAKIIDGPYAGKIVDIEDLGRFCRNECDPRHDPVLQEPDPRLLREIVYP